MTSTFLNELYSNLFNTGIALIVLALAYLFSTLIMRKKVRSDRKIKTYRARLFYIACIVFLFLIARIWVEGFTHLLAVLGLVSAALVITNKETIMNFVGWLVINWRDLFSEGDLIQIQDYKGHVKSFGVLYFTIAEASQHNNDNFTGRLIRIPNGIVATTAIINFSQTSHLLEQHFTILLTKQSDIHSAMSFIKNIVNTTLTEYYKDKKEFSLEYIKKHYKHSFSRNSLDCNVTFQPKLQKPAGIEFTIHYYCFFSDRETIQQRIWLEILEKISSQPKLALAFE